MFQFSRCEPFFTLWTLFYKFNLIRPVWPTFLQSKMCSMGWHVDPIWLIFSVFDPFSKCEPFFTEWQIFPNVTHFWQWPIFRKPFFKTWAIFHSVSRFSKCDKLFHSVKHFSNVTHFSSWPIFYRVTYFWQIDPFFFYYFAKIKSFLRHHMANWL